MRASSRGQPEVRQSRLLGLRVLLRAPVPSSMVNISKLVETEVWTLVSTTTFLSSGENRTTVGRGSAKESCS